MQNKIHKQNFLSDTWTAILGSLPLTKVDTYFPMYTVCTTHIFHVNENLEWFPPVGNILSIQSKHAFGYLETFVTGEL